MSWDEVPAGVTRREAVRHVRIRMAVPDAMPDESMFFLLSLLGGGFLGYLFGVAQLWDVSGWQHLETGLWDQLRRGPGSLKRHHRIAVSPDHQGRDRQSAKVLRPGPRRGSVAERRD